MNNFTSPTLLTAKRGFGKITNVCFALLLLCLGITSAQAQNSLNSGDFSTGSWGTGQSMSASAGGSLIITKAVATSGDKYFRFYGDGSPCGEYQPNTSGDFFTNSTVVTSPNGNCGSSNAWRINVPTSSSQVVFKTDGNNTGISQSVAFVVQGTVQTISSLYQNPVIAGTASTITANLSGAFATGQAAYLRYTTDNFATSTVVTMTGSGTTYTGDIAASANVQGNSVKYYLFTSGTSNVATDGSNADLFTINVLNNSGSNYSYTVPSFFDAFNRGTLAVSNNPSYTYTSTLQTGATASINGNSFLEIATGTVAGVSSVSAPTSSYGNSYNTTLSSNTAGLITWTFNMRFNRSTNPAGIGGSNYGMAVVLAGSSATISTLGNGYAVVYGNSSTPDPIRLVRYTTGITGTLTDICTSATSDISAVNNYASVRVTYAPSTNTWQLFVRDDGASAWADPSSGVTSQKGISTVDATYTGSALANMAFVWSGSTTTTEKGQWDNYRVNLSPIVTPSITSFSASPNTGTSTVGYIGSTVTVTGSGFIGTTVVKVGGSGGTSISPFTIVDDNTITFTQTSATGTIYVQNSAGNSTSGSSLTNAGYITTATGSWVAASWLGLSLPPANADVTIAHNITTTPTITLGKLTVNSGITLTNTAATTVTVTTASTNSGTINVNGTLAVTGVIYTNSGTIQGNSGTTGNIQINQSGFYAGNNITYGSNLTTLTFNNSSGLYGVSNAHVYWPSSSGPTTVNVAGAGGVQLQTGASRTVTNVNVTAGQFDIQSSGLLTVTGTATVTAGVGYFNTNAPVYNSGSTLAFNGTGTYTVGSGDKTWASGTSGNGVPYLVVIGSSGTPTVTISEDRTARTSVTVTAGIFNNNTNVLNIAATNTTGANALVIGGGTLTNGGGTINIGPSNGGNQSISHTGGTLTLSSGTINLNGGIVQSAGTFTMSGGSLNIDPNSGTLASSMGSGTTIWDITGGTQAITAGTTTIVDPPNAGTALTLKYNITSTNQSWSGNTLILGGSSGTNTTTATVGFALDSYKSTGRLTLGNVQVNGGNTTDRYTAGPGTVSDELIIGGTLTINSGSELRLGVFDELYATGNITNNGTFTSLNTDVPTTSAGALHFSPSSGSAATSAQTVSGSGTWRNATSSPTASFQGLWFNNTTSGTSVDMSAIGSISTSVGTVFTAGNVLLGNNSDFTYTNTSPTNTRTAGYFMLQGTGRVKKSFATGASSFTYYIGENTGTQEYSPVTLTVSANATARTLGVGLVDAKHPQMDNPLTAVDYLTRYWPLSDDQTGSITLTAAMTYIAGAADVAGTEANIKAATWNGSTWTQVTGSISSPILTSGSITTTSLSSIDITGRANTGYSYTWVGGTSGFTTDYNTSTNWSPSGVPTSADNVTVNDGTYACIISSGTFSANSFTLNGTGNFQMAATSTLTINGTLTTGGSATATFACGTTLNIASTSSQTIPAFNYGNLNLTGGNRTLASSGTIGICGTLTPGAGTFTTTSSTVDFNGTGSQTVPALSYNNLTISGARTSNNVTLISGGTIGIAGTFSPTATFSSGNYVITSNTIDFSSASSQTIPAFNYNIITNTGNGARTLASSGTVGIANGFTPGSGSYTVTGSTVDYNGTSGFTMTTFTYNNLTISNNKGSGTVSFGSGTITVGSVFTLSATNLTQSAGSGTFIYNSASSQTITAANYYNLTASGGARILASSGTVGIAGTSFTPGSGTYTITGSTVNFNGTSGLTIPALTTGSSDHYNNLTISGSGSYPQGASLSLAGAFNQSAGTYTVTAGSFPYTLTVAGTFTQSAGTFNVTGSSATAGATVTVTGTTSVFSVAMEANSSNTGSTVLFQANGDATFTGSGTTTALDWMAGGTSGTVYDVTFGIKGNFNWSNATGRPYTSGSGTAKGFVFNGTGTTASPQTLTYSGSTVTYGGIYTINTGTVVRLLSNVSIGANTNPYNNFLVNGTLDAQTFVISGGTGSATSYSGFNLNSGSTLITANTAGLNGSITAAAKAFSTTANYVFNGASAQVTGALFTAANNLTINNSSGVTLSAATTIGTSGSVAFTSGTLSLSTFDLTLTSGATFSGNGTGKYVKTSSTGQLKQTVAGTAITFPVGTGAYNPITFTNSGTSDVYGIIETDGTVPAAIDATITVNRRWIVTEGTAGSGTLAVVPQYNSGEEGASYSSGSTVYVGLYVPSTWTQNTATIAGSNPYTASAAGFTNTLATSGTTNYFAIGNTGAFLAPPPTINIPGGVVASSPGSGTSGYIGNTVTINGTNLNLVTIVKVGGSGGTTVTITGQTATTLTFTAINLSGQIYVQNSGGNTTSAETYTNLGYITQASGAYGATPNGANATWLGGLTPVSGANVTINHNPVTLPTAVVTVGTATITSAGYLSATAGVSFSGTTLINNGTYEESGTSFTSSFTNITNTGTLLFSTASTLTLAAGGTYTNNTGGTITGSAGIVAFAGSATINGTAAATFTNLTLNGATTITTVPTINGILKLNSTSASVSAGVNYGSSSTLQYYTGGNPTLRGNEWSAASGAGYPANVQVSNSTTIDAGGTSFTSTALNLSGNLIIDASSSLYTDYGGHNMTVPLTIGGNLILVGNLGGSATGGNIVIKGNWVNNGTAGNYFPNTNTVTFNGTSNQTIGGTNSNLTDFYNLTVNNSANVTLAGSQGVSHTLTLTTGLLILPSTYNFTIDGVAGAISGYSSTKYVQTTGTGRLIQTVSSTDVEFPVGKSAYNPVTLNNSGTSDTYGVYVVDATTSPAANDNTKLVNRYWNINEGIAGGGSLYVKVQYNSGEENANFTTGIIPRVGIYNAGWTVQGATTGGTPVVGPFTYATTSNITAIISGGVTIGAGKDNGFIGVAPTVTTFTPTTGYVGTTVIITGTDFTGATAVAFGGTAAESYTVLTSTSISAVVGFGTTGLVSVTTPSGTSASAGTFTYLPGYITVANGDYNTASTWLNNAVPPAGQNVIIAHTVTINAAPANNPAQLSIIATGSLAFNNASANMTTGTVTIDGTLSFSAAATMTITAGSSFTNNATFTRGTGKVAFAGAGTVNGSAATTFNNLTLNTGALQLGTGTAIDGIFTINGGNISSSGVSPIYTTNSTLYYAGAYNRYLEWDATGVGTIGTTPGYPNNVTVNVGALAIVNSDPTVARALNGTLTINNGATVALGALSAPFTVGNGLTATGTFNQQTSSGAVSITGPVNVASTGTFSMASSTGGTTITSNLNNFGGTITMGSATGNLTVGGDVANTTGTLTLSFTTGSDLYVGGNLSNGGTFTHNTRAVIMNGTAGQQISGSFNSTGTTNCFPYLTVNNSNNANIASDITVTNTLTLTAGKAVLVTANLTLGSGAVISNAGLTRYVRTSSTGQLKQIVASANIFYAVGNNSYNPVTLNNTGGTSDTYGVNVLDGFVSTALDPSYTINRRWQVTEATSTGSNLLVTAQYNGGEENTNYNSGVTDYVGFYNGSSWIERTATRTGSDPYNVASNTSFGLTAANLTSGTQYFAIGRDNGFITAPPVITSFTPTTGYTGTSVVITGTGFTGATAVTFGGTAASSFTVNSATQITATVNTGTSGSIAVTSPSGTGSLAGFIYGGYITQTGATDWATGSSWLGGSVPPAGATATIAHNLAVATSIAASPATVTVNTGVSLNINNAAGALTVSTLLANNGTVTFSAAAGSLTAATFTNAGTLSWSAAGTLNISAGGTLTNNGTFTGGTGAVTTAGAATINGSNAITFNNLNLTTGAVTLSTIPTIDGILKISGGNVSAAPIYTANSTLQYNVSYTRFNEWNATGAGTIGTTPGYPNNVTISTGTFTLLNADAATARAMAGNLLVSAGSFVMGAKTAPLTVAGNVTITTALTLGTSSGGDLYVGGNFANNGTFTHSSRAVYFTGTSQAVSGTLNSTGTTNDFAYMRINNGTNVTLGASAYVVNDITFNSGKITLSTFDLTMATSATITTPTATSYVKTNSTGQLKKVVAATAVLFPVGNSSYNPITLTNTGTSDTYGINVVDAAPPAAADATKTVNRRWVITEATLGGGILTPVVLQYNTGEEGTNYNAGTTPYMGLYNGSSWMTGSATLAGSNPYTATSATSFNASLAATSYFAIGKDGAFGSSINDYYRSITTGNWSAISTWESSPDNVNWYSATAIPGSGTGTGFVTVRNGHTVTVDYIANPATLTVNAGGTIVGSDDAQQLRIGSTGTGALDVAGTITLNSGLVSISPAWLVCGTLTVSSGGTFNNNCGNAKAVSVSTFALNSGGNYNHNATGSVTNGSLGDFPGTSTRTFGATSNTVITKWANGGTAPINLPTTSFGNLTINVATMGGSWNMAANITSIQGNLNIQSTGGFEFRFVANTSATVNILGNVNISGGTLVWTSGTANPTINLTKGLSMTGGNYYADGTTGNGGSSTLNFITGGTGDIDVSGATANVFGNTTIALARLCNVLNTSTVNMPTGKSFTVSGYTNLAPGVIVTGAGTFFVNNTSTATLGIGSIAGITSSPTASGNVQTTTRTFSAGANYVYTGTASQSGGTGLPATLYTLSISNTGASGSNIVTLSQGVGVTSGTAPSMVLNTGLLNTGGNGVNIYDNGGITAIAGNFDPAGTTGSITLSGAATISGTIDFYPSVYQTPPSAKGVTYSTGITMHNVLRLDQYSFVTGNSPSYTTNSTLLYNASGSYSRNVEWSTNTSGPGYPYNVTVKNSTTVDLSANGGGAHALANDLTLGITASPGNLTMGNMNAALTVNGNLIIGANSGTSTLTLSSSSGGDIKVRGNWTRSANGVFVPATRAVYFDGPTGNQTITRTGGETFDYVIVDKAAGNVVLANDMTCDGTLTLTNGLISTGSNKVIISSGVSVARTNGWVAGNLQKSISAAGAVNYEIGASDNYRPLNLTFNSVSTAGTLTAAVAQASGVYSPLTGSGLDGSTVLLRSYKLTNSSLAGNYDAVFNFVAGDLQAGSSTSTFVVRNTTNSGSTWTNKTIGTRTLTSTAATGITSFGDFVIGNTTALVVTTDPANTAVCTGGSPAFTSVASVTPSITGTAITVQWQENVSGTWNNISAGGIYGIVTSGTTTVTSTLTITGATIGMNTYQYRAIFSDLNGSVNSNAATLTVNALPTASITGSANTCPSVATLLTANATAGSGTITSYQWKLGGTDITGATSSTYSTSTAGSYTVVVTNSNTCSVTSAAFVLSVYAAPAKPTISGPVSACSPSTITLTSSHTGGNLWSPGGATTDQITINMTGSYSYTVSYTDVNGCISPSSDPYNVVLHPQHLITATPSGPLEFCNGGSVDLTSSETSGNMWSPNGETSQTITATVSGTYTVTQTDANGCVGSVGVVVKVNPIVTPTVSISASPSISVCSGTPITFTATPTNEGTTPTYQWYVNNVLQSGATATTFTATLSNNDIVKVELTSSEPCTTVNPAMNTVTVDAANNWTGTISTNWSTSGNWSCNAVPSATDDVVIPAGGNQPSLTASTTIHNIILNTGAVLSLGGQTFTLNGAISGAGTVAGSLTSNMIVNGTGTLRFNTSSNTINDLTINSTGTVTLGSKVFVAGIFTPTAGTFSLGADTLVLKAGTEGNYANTKTYPATGTVGIVSATLDYSGGGKILSERYVPAKRAFRFIASSVNTTSSLRANWMEGAFNPGPGYGTNNNPTPGYGTHITGSATVGDNLDWTYTNNPSLFVNDNATQTWNPIYNSNGTLSAGYPYRVLIRGNRSVDLSANAATPSATILREAGSLVTGDVTLGSASSTPSTMPLINGANNAYSFVGNPYAAAVSWLRIYAASTSISATYYAYDANVNAKGAYVTYNALTGLNQFGNFTISKVDSIIQPGQAFFVQTNGASPVLRFKEIYKKSEFTAVWRTVSTMPKISLHLLSAADSAVLDGNVALFDNQYSAAIGEEDSYKFTNIDENMSIASNSKLLSIEARPEAVANDSIPLKIWQYRQTRYILSVNSENFDPSMVAVVKDKYLNIETPVNLAGSTMVPFSITTDAASAAADRFTILFKTSSTLPVTVTDVKAYQKERGIQVEWTAHNELNIARYEVEKSANGVQFEKVSSSAARNRASAELYSWFDNNPVNGGNYYRIKIVDKSGEVKYTRIVKVNIGKGEAAVTIYPNPVQGGQLNLQFANLDKGKYKVVLYNGLGEKVFAQTIEHNGGSANYTVKATNVESKGSYRMVISNNSFENTQTIIFE